MITEIVADPYSKNSINENHPAYNRIISRRLSKNDWIDRHASGTLRKNNRLGFAAHDQYVYERTAWDLGYHWQVIAATRVTIGIPITEGDVKGITEAGWHADAYITKNPFSCDVFSIKYISVDINGEVKEGIGLVAEKLWASWIGNNKTVFCLMLKCDKNTGQYGNCLNPS